MKEKYEQVPIEKIRCLENVRQKKGDVSSLMKSIKEVGLLQPIRLANVNNDLFIKFGNRRLMACKKLGWKKIPAIVDYGKENFLEFLLKNISENIEREDVLPIEMGRIFLNLKEKHGLNVSEIAAKLGKTNSFVSSAIGLFQRVPKSVAKDIVLSHSTYKKGKVPFSIAIKVMQMRKEFGLSKKHSEVLFKLSRKDGITGMHLRLLSSLLRQGKDIDKSIKDIKEYRLFLPKCPILKKDYDRLRKKYKGLTMNDMFSKIIERELKR